MFFFIDDVMEDLVPYWKRQGFSGFAAVIFAVFALGSVPTKEQLAQREAEQAEQRVILERYRAALGAAHRRLSSDGPSLVKPCDGRAMRQAIDAGRTQKGSASRGIRVVHLDFLRRFAVNEQAAYDASGAPFDWMTDNTFEGHFRDHPDSRTPYANQDTAERVAETFLPERYLAVVVPDPRTEARMPRVAEDSYVGGAFDGSVELIDQNSGETICRGAITVRSSDEVQWQEGGRGVRALGNETFEEAVIADFEDNFEIALSTIVPKEIGVSTKYGHLLR